MTECAYPALKVDLQAIMYLTFCALPPLAVVGTKDFAGAPAAMNAVLVTDVWMP